MHAYKHTHIHAYLHQNIHIYMHKYIHTWKHTCIHTYMKTIQYEEGALSFSHDSTSKYLKRSTLLKLVHTFLSTGSSIEIKATWTSFHHVHLFVQTAAHTAQWFIVIWEPHFMLTLTNPDKLRIERWVPAGKHIFFVITGGGKMVPWQHVHPGGSCCYRSFDFTADQSGFVLGPHQTGAQLWTRPEREK